MLDFFMDFAHTEGKLPMKKLFIPTLFFLLFVVFSKQSFAQQTKYPLNTNPDVKQDFHNYTQNVFIETLSTLTCFIGGIDMLNPDQKCLGMDPVTKKIGYVENSGGLASVMGGMIGATYNIPVSSTHYGYDLASHFGITRTSYAQFNTGIGFNGLLPVLEIWKTFRNLTYLLFVLIFILLGLGIMFRLNIDARSVMTIQNQIPKIIIGLILITLSYAIAGFLIDMMYVGIYLVIHIFQSQGLTTMSTIDTNPVSAMGSLGGIHDIAYPAAKGVGGIISSLFTGSFGTVLGTIITGMIGGFIGGGTGIPFAGAVVGLIGALAGGLFGGKILGLIAMVIAYLIIAIAVFTSLFRVWFMLIKAYIFIFLDVIFAPFWIVGGMMPGAPGGVGPWIRSLIANLSAFPTVIVLFMIGKTMQDQAFNAGKTFVPPLIGNPGNAGDAIASILGLGIILIMPEAVTITKSTLKAPDMKYTSAIGKAIGQGQGYVSKPIGGMWKELTGEKRDGSKGILRSTFEDRAAKIGKGMSQKTGATWLWKKTNFYKWYKDGRARQAREGRNLSGSEEAGQPTIATEGSAVRKKGLARRIISAPRRIFRRNRPGNTGNNETGGRAQTQQGGPAPQPGGGAPGATATIPNTTGETGPEVATGAAPAENPAPGGNANQNQGQRINTGEIKRETSEAAREGVREGFQEQAEREGNSRERDNALDRVDDEERKKREGNA